jgi:hypothetical protein
MFYRKEEDDLVVERYLQQKGERTYLVTVMDFNRRVRCLRGLPKISINAMTARRLMVEALYFI